MAIAPPPYAAPVVEDFGGWYLRGDIGFSNQRVKTKEWVTYSSLLSLEQDNGFDTAGIFGIGVGYRFNNWFRTDVIGQYRGKANFHSTDRFVFSNAGVPTAGVDTYTGSKSEWLVLANAYADLGTWWCVTPFIGAGVGFARNTISHYVDTNIANGRCCVSPVRIKVEFCLGSAYWFGLRVTPNFTVELGYSYVSLGNATTGVDLRFHGVREQQ